MSKSKMKEDFRKMVRWSIRKMFENSPDDTITLQELQKQLEIAWDELVDDGEIIINKTAQP